MKIAGEAKKIDPIVVKKKNACRIITTFQVEQYTLTRSANIPDLHRGDRIGGGQISRRETGLVNISNAGCETARSSCCKSLALCVEVEDGGFRAF